MRYFVARVVQALIVVWAVGTLVFFMLRAVPGDPIAAMLADVDPTAADAIRAKLGLDQPVLVQYLFWLRNTLSGDLGQSLYGSHQAVNVQIAEAVPRTVSLALVAFLVSFTLGLSAGIISAVKKDSLLDYGFNLAAFLGISMPSFWIGIVLIIVFAVNLRWFPAIGYKPMSAGLDQWLRYLILPGLAVGLPFSASIARLTRSAMLEVLGQDYISLARSKGLNERRVIFRHALRNALIPVITVMGISLALLFSGSVVVENVFAIKGLGRVLIQSILNRDYPVVQGSILLVAVLLVFMNLAVDLLYRVIDPRISYDYVDYTQNRA
ncbi:MAG: ABC transporter permease, partial [Chloroflexi bacterium]|nr:ABC transporter permease [Chloroflexota bacterium]